MTPATDVFALGALTGFVAGGVPPFGNGPESGALYRVVHEHPDLGRIPRELHDLLSWCLAKSPRDRPTTADLIAAVHAHPLVGPRPEFTDGWLPRPMLEEVGGRTDAGPAGEPGRAGAARTGAPPGDHGGGRLPRPRAGRDDAVRPEPEPEPEPEAGDGPGPGGPGAP